MKQVFFATTNKSKVSAIVSALSKFDIKVIQKSLEIPEIRSDDIKEVAIHKAIYAFKQIKKPVIVLDAGFYVRSIGGFPQMYVNFALKTIGISGILKLVENKDKSCEFRECMAFFDEILKKPVIFEDTVKGKLTDKPRGVKQDYFWSDLSLIFIPEGKDKTLAEMTPKEYHKWDEEFYENSYLTRFAKWFSER